MNRLKLIPILALLMSGIIRAQEDNYFELPTFGVNRAYLYGPDKYLANSADVSLRQSGHSIEIIVGHEDFAYIPVVDCSGGGIGCGVNDKEFETVFEKLVDKVEAAKGANEPLVIFVKGSKRWLGYVTKANYVQIHTGILMPYSEFLQTHENDFESLKRIRAEIQ